jgi:hypothetical protein
MLTERAFGSTGSCVIPATHVVEPHFTAQPPLANGDHTHFNLLRPRGEISPLTEVLKEKGLELLGRESAHPPSTSHLHTYYGLHVSTISPLQPSGEAGLKSHYDLIAERRVLGSESTGARWYPIYQD